MAGRRQDLETRLIAKDDASKVIDKVAGELDELEKRDTSIDLTAEDHASDDVKSLSQLLAGLSDEDKTVVLNAKVSDAERNIDRILRSLRDVDKMDQQEIDVRVEMLGDARAELDRVQTELRDLDGSTADVRVDVETSGLDELKGALDGLPGPLGSIASTVGAGGAVVGGVAAIAGSLGTAALSAADMAIEAKTMADLTGDTVEDASRLQSVWKTSGADINDLNDVLLQMNGVLKENPELAAQIGINLRDGATIGQRFQEVVKKLGDFTGTASDKALIMSQVFGEEGVRQVAKMTALVGDDLEPVLARLSDSQIISDEDVDQAIELKAQVAEMTAQFQQMAVEIGQTIIPLMSDMVDLANDIKLPTFVEWSAQPLETFNGQLDRAKISFHALVTEDIKGTVAADLGEVAETTEVIADETEATTEHLEKSKDIADQLARKTDDWKRSIDEVKVALDEAMIPLEDGSAAAEAFETALGKVGRGKGLDVLERFGDTEEAIRGVFDVVKENKGVIPDIFDVGRQSSRDLRDSLEDLAGTYQTELVETFKESGSDFDKVRQRIKELRLTLAARFAKKFELDLEVADDRAKVESMVNAVLPTEAEVEVGIKLANKDLLQLKADLAIARLQTLLPDTALQLEVDLAEGEIGPREAVATAQAILDENGVEVDLGVNTRKANDDLIVFAREERGITLTAGVTGLAEAAAVIDAGPGGRGWPAIEVPVKPVIVGGGYSYITGGGAGTLAATTAGPSLYGATATPMAGPTLPTLMLPVSAPQQQQQPIIINNVLNAAVVGDPYAVARAMEDGTRRAARLMPRNQ